MCLDYVIKEEVLEEDLTVLKIVHKTENGYCTGTGLGGSISFNLNDDVVDPNGNDLTIHSFFHTKPYVCGFHFYAIHPDISVLDKIKTYWGLRFINHGFVVLECTIPKGTPVTIGEQNNLTAIVAGRFRATEEIN